MHDCGGQRGRTNKEITREYQRRTMGKHRRNKQNQKDKEHQGNAQEKPRNNNGETKNIKGAQRENK